MTESGGKQDHALAEAPQQNKTEMATEEMTTEELTTKELKVFNDKKEMLAKFLVHSLTRLASLAAQERMISDAAVVAEKFGQTSTMNDRAVFLLSAVMKKMDKKMNGGADVMDKFLESIDDNVQLHGFLSEKYDEKAKKGKKEKELLKDHQAIIVSSLEYSLVAVAGKLLQCGTINDAEHGMIVNPAAKYNALAVHNILESIGGVIETDPEKFQKFLSDVLEEIGGPAETLAEKMREDLKKLQSDEKMREDLKKKSQSDDTTNGSDEDDEVDIC